MSANILKIRYIYTQYQLYSSMDKNTFKQLTLKANMGSPEAQFQLYQIYYDGDEELDIGWDPDNAVKWVQKAAD